MEIFGPAGGGKTTLAAQMIAAVRRAGEAFTPNDCRLDGAGVGAARLSIVSTPKGVMSDAAARNANVGGEVLCTVF